MTEKRRPEDDEVETGMSDEDRPEEPVEDPEPDDDYPEDDE